MTTELTEKGRSLKILLVEDSEDLHCIFKSFLKSPHYSLEIAENGELGVQMFISGEYDAVLMDLQMPVKDGYDATKEIRMWEEEKGVRQTPIILITAHTCKKEVQRCIDVGCNSYVPKPFNKSILREAIRELTKE